MPFDNPLKKLSKPQLYASIGGGTLITGYLVVRHHSKTGSWNPWSSTGSSASTAQTGNDPVTGLPYSEDSTTDPVTGLTYLAEAEEYGSVATAEAAVSQYGQSVATGTGTSSIPAGESSAGTSTLASGAVTSSTYVTNAAWSQAVQAGLSDISGSTSYDGTDIGSAIGAYLGNQPLTSAQAALVSTALAEYGPPPVGTYSIIVSSSAGTGTTTTGTGTGTGTVTGTGTSGATAPATTAPKTAPGSLAVSATAGSTTVSWAAVAGATEYECLILGTEGSVQQNSTVAQTHAVYSTATVGPGTHITKVRAGNSSGWGPYTASKTFTAK